MFEVFSGAETEETAYVVHCPKVVCNLCKLHSLVFLFQVHQ